MKKESRFLWLRNPGLRSFLACPGLPSYRPYGISVWLAALARLVNNAGQRPRVPGPQHRGREKVAAASVTDCQEPPYADPHVRWCGSREGKPSRRPDWTACCSSKPSIRIRATGRLPKISTKPSVRPAPAGASSNGLNDLFTRVSVTVMVLASTRVSLWLWSPWPI